MVAKVFTRAGINKLWKWISKRNSAWHFAIHCLDFNHLEFAHYAKMAEDDYQASREALDTAAAAGIETDERFTQLTDILGDNQGDFTPKNSLI